jgi:hypothetical protein
MDRDFTQEQTRREVFAVVLRYAALGAMTAIGYLVSVRRGGLVRRGGCAGAKFCSECAMLKKCNLPQALAVKEILMRIENVRK